MIESSAYFEGIASVIEGELDAARHSVDVAVAWFTDPALFESLCEAQRRGVAVRLLITDDEINRGGGVDHERLPALGGRLYRLKAGGGPLMHNKFCVVDRSDVITGSYNWSRKARSNHENVTVTRHARALALSFTEEFDRIVAAHFPSDAPTMDLGVVLQRLSLVKQVLALGDTEDLPLHLARLRRLALPEGAGEIVSLLEAAAYGEAVARIDAYVRDHSRIVVRVDPEAEALRLELRILEVEVGSLAAEEAAMHKRLFDFGARHARELGPLLMRILERRKRRLEGDPSKQGEYERAKEDHESYGREYGEASGRPDLPELSDSERDEIRALFRKGVHACHPDKVSEGLKDVAEETFKELREAYDRNDLDRVREIVRGLDERRFTPRSETPCEKELLRAAVVRLRAQLNVLRRSIEETAASEAWRRVVSAEDLDAWFERERRRLEVQLELLEEVTVGD